MGKRVYTVSVQNGGGYVPAITLAKLTEDDDAGVAYLDIGPSVAGLQAPHNLGDTIGGMPLLYSVTLPDSTGNTDLIVKDKIKIVDFWIVADTNTPDASSTVQLDNGTGGNHISDAVAYVAVAGSAKHAATLAAGFQVVAAGGTLRFVRTKTTHVGGTAYVLAVRSS